MRGITVLQDKIADIKKSFRDLPKKNLLIGIPENKDGRAAEQIGNADIGYINENGSAIQNIPARPFLLPGVKAVQDEILKELAIGSDAFLSGKSNALDEAYARAGLKAVSSVRATLTAGDGYAPLSASTLKAREAKGATRTKPLIDTGQLRNSITYVVRGNNG